MLALSVIPGCLFSSGSKSGPCGQSGIELRYRATSYKQTDRKTTKRNKYRMKKLPRIRCVFVLKIKLFCFVFFLGFADKFWWTVKIGLRRALLLLRLHVCFNFKDIHCIGIQDDWLRVSIDISMIWSEFIFYTNATNVMNISPMKRKVVQNCCYPV